LADKSTIPNASVIGNIVSAASYITKDIIKINVWLEDLSNRSALHSEWTAMFPNPEDRPARQAFVLETDSIVLVYCNFMAALEN
tara:strand:- start:25 stop:276 length:252 start_codon:yes stop_codon:yes gene_type:complete